MNLRLHLNSAIGRENFLRRALGITVFGAMVFSGVASAAQVTLSNLSQIYSGTSKSATVTTVPAGLAYTITYAGSATAPINAGSYAVVATVVDAVETGTASGILVISKATQSISFNSPPAKTYGDAPFAVSATASSGLPITKWESSDPSVASISATGDVTILGAGQTSILVTQSGNANYNAAWIAQPLNVARSAVPLPSPTITTTYNGAAQPLDSSALPAGLATEISYRNTGLPEPTATPQVVYQNGPDTLDLSYSSTGFQAVGYWGMAKYVSLAGTARKLHSCDVTLVSWARYDSSSPYGSLDWATAHPELVVPPKPGISIPGDSGGYYHPVTLSFYDYSNDGVTESYRLITTQTTQALIPWRPSKLADGVTAYTNNGYAFRVPFSFPDGVVLPTDVWVAVSFNTNTFGPAPIGVPGPYDSLNVAKPSGQQAGTTQLANFTLLLKDWRWQSASGNNGPMLRLRTVPTNETATAPQNAGTYEIKTKAAAFGADGQSISTLLINKAPLAINISNLNQVRDGNPKSVTINTTPVGVSTSVTYGGSPAAPSVFGTYAVAATSNNANYEGQANATLRIGDSFATWQTAVFSSSGLPPEQTTGSADPDGDGLSNFLEYAGNLNPLLGDVENNPAPMALDPIGNTLSFNYRRNLNALDIDYSIQGTFDFSGGSPWDAVTPLSETTVSDDGSTKVVKASIARPAGQQRFFLRLKASR